MKHIDNKIEELQKKLDRIDDIEKRIFELEKLKAMIPLMTQPAYPYPLTVLLVPNGFNPNIHYHNGQPCYKSPCIWVNN